MLSKTYTGANHYNKIFQAKNKQIDLVAKLITE